MIRKLALAAVLAAAALAGGTAARADDLRVVRGLTPAPYGETFDRRDDGFGRGPRLEEETGGWRGRWGRSDEVDYLMPPRRLTRMLYRRGFDDIAIIRLRGPNYIAEAIAPRGHRVRLVVDGRSGEITGFRVIDWSGDRRRADGWGRGYDGQRTGW